MAYGAEAANNYRDLMIQCDTSGLITKTSSLAHLCFIRITNQL